MRAVLLSLLVACTNPRLATVAPQTGRQWCVGITTRAGEGTACVATKPHCEKVRQAAIDWGAYASVRKIGKCVAMKIEID